MASSAAVASDGPGRGCDQPHSDWYGPSALQVSTAFAATSYAAAIIACLGQRGKDGGVAADVFDILRP